VTSTCVTSTCVTSTCTLRSCATPRRRHVPEGGDARPTPVGRAEAGDPTGTVIDLDLHGTVGVRLVDAGPGDVARVRRQLGPLPASRGGDPQVAVRFVDALRPSGPLTMVGHRSAGFTADGLYVLRTHRGVTAKAFLPLSEVGRQLEIVCERSMPSVPLLLAIVNVCAVARGVLPLHASAFEHEGRGVVVCGWAKGGKTEVLLSYAARGARYVGDEWVYLRPDRTFHGVPEPMRLWDWQVRQLTQVRSRLTRDESLRLRTLRVLAAVTAAAGRARPTSDVVRRVHETVQHQQWVQVPPERLFGAAKMLPAGHLDELVLTSVHSADGIEVTRASGRDVGQRMRASLRHERQPLVELYDQFRFAFPARASEALDSLDQHEASLIEQVLPEQAWWLRHPFPVDILGIYPELERALRSGATDGRNAG
jgi:hypothetical protein